MNTLQALALLCFSMVTIGYIILVVKLYHTPLFRRVRKWLLPIAILDIAGMAVLVLWLFKII